MSPDDQRRPPRRRRPKASRDKRTEVLDVVVADERGRPLRMSSLTCWLQRVAPSRAHGTVSIALVSDGRVRELNRTYRRRDYPTDVLSFAGSNGSAPLRTQRTRGKRTVLPSASSVSSAVNDRTLGDIVIARGVAQRQAREAGHSQLTELKILALHGLLHLLGYDHHGDGGTMRRVEQQLRRKGGLREGLIERANASPGWALARKRNVGPRETKKAPAASARRRRAARRSRAAERERAGVGPPRA